MKNPYIVKYNIGQYIIRFIRNDWNTLCWIQDLTGKKMKGSLVQREPVFFSSYQDAEQEVKNIVIPYLLKEKNIDPKDIIGWD